MIGETPAPSFGPYKILAPLGRGGMGEVFRAWDPRLEREVALKILHERTDVDPDRIQRFIAEARAASALNHPHILTVFDAAVDGATPYIVSELIEGESLRDLMRRGPVPLKRVTDLATQIADGLSEAHAAGIVHRDLKPENIMVTRGGRAKILDFGLAQPVGVQPPGTAPADLDGDTATDPGLLAGTVPYMSPEHARGSATDFRSDQFSFGLILYELMTGRPAFRRETSAETLDAIISEEPPSVASANPTAPLALAWIIERCLSKNPNDRYGVTSDLERDLRMLRDRLGEVVARDARAKTSAPVVRSLARNAVLIAALGALFAGGLLTWRTAPEFLQPDLTGVRFSPFATEDVYKGFPAWSPDGSTIAYSAEVDGVLQIFTRRRDSATAAQATHQAYDCKYPFWSPDSRRIYYVSLARDREGLWAVSTGGGQATMVLENATLGAISPDGTTLAFLRDEEQAGIVGTARLWLTSADGKAPPRRYDRAPFDGLRFSDSAMSFSPDGAWIGLSGTPATIGLQPERRGWHFWRLPTGEGTPARRFQWWPDIVPRVSSFSWMPDSQHIVISVARLGMTSPDLWIADVHRDRAWPITRGPVKSSFPSVSPSGNEVVFMSDEPHYDVVEIPLDGGPIRPLPGTTRNESDPAWSEAANAYVFVTDRTGQEEIWLRTGEGPLAERRFITQANFTERTVLLGSPAFSPDGQRVAYQRSASNPLWPLRIWYSNVASPTPVPLLAEAHESYQGPPTWSPTGESIAFPEWDGKQWKLVKVRLGSEVAETLRSDGVSWSSPQWSPTGEWITWETEKDFLLVSSADGRQEKPLGTGGWLVHTWSKDGRQIYGIRQEERRLALFVVDIRTGAERMLADIGPSPPVNNQLKGLSLGRDGRTLVTSMPRMRGDLWLLEGLSSPSGLLDRLWSGLRPWRPS